MKEQGMLLHRNEVHDVFDATDGRCLVDTCVVRRRAGAARDGARRRSDGSRGR